MLCTDITQSGAWIPRVVVCQIVRTAVCKPTHGCSHVKSTQHAHNKKKHPSAFSASYLFSRGHHTDALDGGIGDLHDCPDNNPPAVESLGLKW